MSAERKYLAFRNRNTGHTSPGFSIFIFIVNDCNKPEENSTPFCKLWTHLEGHCYHGLARPQVAARETASTYGG